LDHANLNVSGVVTVNSDVKLYPDQDNGTSKGRNTRNEEDDDSETEVAEGLRSQQHHQQHLQQQHRHLHHRDGEGEGEDEEEEEEGDEGAHDDDLDDSGSFSDSLSSSPSIPDDDIDFALVYALHTFLATVDGQASVVKGDKLLLLDDTNSYWWLVRVLKTQAVGYIPAENIETPWERLARLNKHRNVDVSLSLPRDSKKPVD
jgi:hypothetical protein